MIHSRNDIREIISTSTQLGAIAINLLQCLEMHGGGAYDLNALLEEIARDGKHSYKLNQMVKRGMLPLLEYASGAKTGITEDDYKLSPENFCKKFANKHVEVSPRDMMGKKCPCPEGFPWMYDLVQVPAGRNLTIAQLRMDLDFGNHGIRKHANWRELVAFSKLVGGINFGSIEVIALGADEDSASRIYSAFGENQTYKLEKTVHPHGPLDKERIERSHRFLMRSKNHNPRSAT